MLIEDLDLPYEYADNTRAGTMTTVALAILASIALGVMAYFSPILSVTIPWWVALIPGGILLHRSYFYSLYLNATHEALRNAEADARLDKYVEDTHAAKLSTAVLDPIVFARKVAEDVG